MATSDGLTETHLKCDISVGTNNVWGVTAGDEIYSMKNITFVSSEIEFSLKLIKGSQKQIVESTFCRSNT